MKKILASILFVFAIIVIAYAKGGIHGKACRIRSFHGFKSTTTTSVNETNDHTIWKSKGSKQKVSNWPWWLPNSN
jgi:hypothetical protein